MIAYKFLRAGGRSAFTAFRWELPVDRPGRWIEAPADPCRSGIHACRIADLPLWVSRALFEIELDGEIVEDRMKLVASRGRLLRRVDAWDDAARDAYVRMCADRAHALARTAALPGWERVIEPSIPEGPALLGFIAARIADEGFGSDGYHAERARQSAWLAERLSL